MRASTCGKVKFQNFSNDATLAAQAPQSMGCLNVVSIAGGFDACAAAGKTVVKPEQPAFDGDRWPLFCNDMGPFNHHHSVKSLTPKWVWVVLIRIDFG
jgi:hypothetical protein